MRARDVDVVHVLVKQGERVALVDVGRGVPVDVRCNLPEYPRGQVQQWSTREPRAPILDVDDPLSDWHAPHYAERLSFTAVVNPPQTGEVVLTTFTRPSDPPFDVDEILLLAADLLTHDERNMLTALRTTTIGGS